MTTDQEFIPALGLHALTPLYDPCHRWLLGERQVKGALSAEASTRQPGRVLDLGCGTATLALGLARSCPCALIVGLDVDRAMLRIGQHKVRRALLPIMLHGGSALHLPYANASFDLVVSSLMLHHLASPAKYTALAEVFRVLRPTCEVLIIDYARPQTAWATLLSLSTHWLEEIADHHRGVLPAILCAVGFNPVEEVARFWGGTLALYCAKKP